MITSNDTIYTDTTLYDTTFLEVIHPEVGDIFHIEIDRPFSVSDIYSFTTVPSRVDNSVASSQLDKIAVVPNPYIVQHHGNQDINMNLEEGQEKLIS